MDEWFASVTKLLRYSDKMLREGDGSWEDCAAFVSPACDDNLYAIAIDYMTLHNKQGGVPEA
jgi:hypothetical protein